MTTQSIAAQVSAASKSAKAENYTKEQTAELVAAYAANASKETVEAFAAKFGKSVRSIVAKLSREGIYQKAERTTKTGEPVESKEAVADAIGRVLNMSEPDTASLTKANKKALQVIFKALANSKPLESGENPAVAGE